MLKLQLFERTNVKFLKNKIWNFITDCLKYKTSTTKEKNICALFLILYTNILIKYIDKLSKNVRKLNKLWSRNRWARLITILYRMTWYCYPTVAKTKFSTDIGIIFYYKRLLPDIIWFSTRKRDISILKAVLTNSAFV